MEQLFPYVGTKIILATPMSHFDFLKRQNKPIPDHENSLGYMVKYPDGYISWSPKSAFNSAYRQITDAEKEMMK